MCKISIAYHYNICYNTIMSKDNNSLLQYEEAIAIIYTAIKHAKPIYKFKRWDKINYLIRSKALQDYKWIKSAIKEEIPLEQARELRSYNYENVI